MRTELSALLCLVAVRRQGDNAFNKFIHEDNALGQQLEISNESLAGGYVLFEVKYSANV